MPTANLITTKPAHNRLNLVGHKFGLLTVRATAGRHPQTRALYWECICTCGKTTLVKTGSLRSGATQSCGCHEGASTHRLTRTRAYRSWFAANKRCLDPNNKQYPDYGGRGITVCKGWQSVENFVADMGQPPQGLTIDRINNDGGYWCGHCEQCIANNWPKNCRWTDWETQNRNQRSNHYITALGKTMTVVEWVHETGIPKNTILNRLNRGWNEEKAVTAIGRRKIKS